MISKLCNVLKIDMDHCFKLGKLEGQVLSFLLLKTLDHLQVFYNCLWNKTNAEVI